MPPENEGAFQQKPDDVSSYDNFARFYDLKYQPIDYDVDFYLQMARRAGANARALELACGSGRVALPLIEAGFRVTGLDLSANMLSIAREKAEAQGKAAVDRTRFIQAEMQNFDLRGEQFDFIFIALNSFQHLLTQPDQLRCLQTVRSHLAPAGIFILDVINPEEKEHYPADGRVEFDGSFKDPISGNLVQVFLSTTAQPSEQLRVYTYFFDEIERSGSMKRTVAEFSLRYAYRFELELLLEKAGFAVEDLYGSHEFDEYGFGSSKLIFVCRKKS